MCSTPGYEINIPGFEQLNLTTPQGLKRAIIDYGPIATFLSYSGYELHGSVNDENHAVLIIGWDGSQWHIKDSWPNQNGINFKSIDVFDSEFNAQFFRVKYENNGSVISCSGSECSSVFSGRTPTDNDHDGFYYWGIGPKPAGCTGPCKMDFNDNDITKIFLNSDYVEVNTPTVTSPDLVCTNGTIAERTFNLNNFPTGFTVTWNVSEPTYFNSPTNGSGISATISPKSQYSGDELYITFTISDGCGSAQYRKYFTINGPADSKIDINVVPSNAPTPIRVSGVWLLCPNSTYYLYCNNTSTCSTANYQWTIPSGWTKYEQSSNYIRINTNSTPFGTVNVNATTCCGTNHLIVTRNFSQGGSCSYFAVYPNPAVFEFNIGFVEEFDIETLDETSTIEIYDAGFTKKYKAEKIEKNMKVKTDDWKEGIYYVIFSYKGQKYYEKVKIRR